MEKAKVSHEIATKVAEWWADKVCGDVKFDNGDPSLSGLFAAGLASSMVEEVTAEQRQKFIDAIVSRIEGEEELYLCVDYGPCKILIEAANESGVSGNNFPWKTSTIMQRNYGEYGFKIYGRHGYRAEPELIAESEVCAQN